MFDTRIEILEYTEERDEYNDLTKSLRRVAVCYAQRTENGGRENLYAGRSVKGIRPTPYLEQAYTENSERTAAIFGDELAAAVEKFVNKNFASVSK